MLFSRIDTMIRKFIIFIALILLLSVVVQPTNAAQSKRKPRPTPTPSPTTTPLPTPTPTPTPIPTPTPTPTPVPQTADIAVNIVSTVGVDYSIRHDITVTNLGPNPATDVQFCSIVDPLTFSLIGLEQRNWILVLGGGSGRYANYCSVYGELPFILNPGASESMSFTQGGWSGYTMQNSVDASSVGFDPNLTNNSMTTTTTP